MKSLISRRNFAALACSALASLCAPAWAADVKFGYGTAEEHSQGTAARKFAELVAQKTGGRISVKTFGSAKLGSDVQMQSALQGGTQEFMVGATSTLVGTVKDFAIFDFPFLFSNTKEADAILDGPVGRKLMQKLESRGLVGLAYWENGFRNTTTSRRPIQKLEDFQGLKFRVMQSKVYLDLFSGFGANAVPLPFPELYMALESRTVDAQENPLALIDSQKFYEVQKYLSLTAHSYSPFIVLASKKFWDAQPKDVQEAITAAAREAGTLQRKLSRETNETLLASLKARGMQVNEIAPAELARMRERSQAVTAKYSQELDQSLLAELQSELNKARAAK